MEKYTKHPFSVKVNSKTYNVEPVWDGGYCRRFKISTDCEYLFTLCVDEYDNWQMEKDVTPLDKELINEIGSAIEDYAAGERMPE
jgi:hypothetical protein